MNLQSVYNFWKRLQSVSEEVGEAPEDVLDNALKLYLNKFKNRDNEPLNQFIKDLDNFIKITLKDKDSVHYNFVLQWIDMIVKCGKPDKTFEFRMRKMVHILYKKNKECSKLFLNGLGVTREELQDRILEDIFGGDV